MTNISRLFSIGNLKKGTVIIYAVPFFMPFANAFRIIDGFYQGPLKFLFLSSCFISFIILIKSVFIEKIEAMRVSIFDILITCSVLYIGCLSFFNNNNFLHNTYSNLLLCYFLYFVFKNLITADRVNSDILLIVLLITTIVQVIVGFMQQYSLLISGTSFKVTGTFDNPGILGNYLAIILPLATSMLFSTRENTALGNIKRLMGFLATISIIAILPFTNARTAWLAALSGLLTFAYFFYSCKKEEKSRRLKKWILITALMGITFASLVKYKPRSSLGRTVIYKASLAMVSDKVVEGFGMSNFASEYNKYQAQYFKTHLDKHERFVASDVKFAFNEFLQIQIELGIFGFLLFLCAICIIFYFTKDKMTLLEIGARASFISLLVCCMFSYPFRSVGLWAALAFIMAILTQNHPVVFVKEIRKIYYFLIFITISWFTYFQVKDYESRVLWKRAIEFNHIGDIINANRIYNNIYQDLAYDGYFLYSYGIFLKNSRNIRESNRVLLEATRYLNDSDIYTDIGDNYVTLKQFRPALKYYLEASHMVPIKFYPRYGAFTCYLKLGYLKEALKIANEINLMPVKVNSVLVYSIRMEIRDYLKKHE